jgi:hypothetical protein
MTNSNSRHESASEGQLREVWALKQALELLGFDVDALVIRMCERQESYWQRLALQSANVAFDERRALRIEPLLSEAIVSEAESWLASVRLVSSQHSASTAPQPGGQFSARALNGGRQP